MEELKSKAKKEKLWNLFLPKETDQGRFGAGVVWCISAYHFRSLNE